MFVVRQPIYDRQLNVAGYELLFRDGSSNSAQLEDDDSATLQVLVGAFPRSGLRSSSAPRPHT